MKLIPLSTTSKKYGGKYFAMVDDEDYEWLMQWKWRVQKKETGNVYAARLIWDKCKWRSVHMHRLILGITDPNLFGDHKDRNGLNNQRKNLRIATRSQNGWNSRPSGSKTSKYRGVSFNSGNRKYQAAIRCNSDKIYLGCFVSEEDAARAYDEKAKELHGEFATLNFG